MKRKATCPAVLSFRIKQLRGGEIGMKKLLLVFYLLIVVSVPLVGISSAAIVYVPDNYSSIQEAINAASADDTVIVRNGTYSENVELNKKLSLIGERLPTVDAQQNGSAIRITADGCAVKGFRCVNAKYPSNAGIRVDSDSNVIVNNSCGKNNYGICLDWRSSCNTIENNTCFENCEEGIDLSHSSNNTIENNTCFENCEQHLLREL
jgi:parallel beta-helix repeat protein